MFNNNEFENRLNLLSKLEHENYFNRKLEIQNWLRTLVIFLCCNNNEY